MYRKGLYRNYIKRLIDLILAVVALVILSPVLLITALLVRIKLGSPVVFKQARPGRNEKFFYLYKFRSMTNEVGEDGKLLPDAQRLTKFGKILRSSSLDELLELLNIIKGDMSIVGPRPLSIYYLPHYSEESRARHDVRPGLTGLAQVNGRNNLPWDARLEMDIQYVNNVSFLFDVKIILKTVLKVLRHSDISVRGTTKVKDFGPYSILKEENDGGTQLADMSYSEIGSFFWLSGEEKQGHNSKIDWLPLVEDSAFTFSGRNAIDIALKDILKERNINRVLVPSYCCVSMLQSFVDRGLKIEFYEVGLTDGKFAYQIKNANENTVVLLMSYFGLNSENAHEAIESYRRKGAVIIEDITHSLLNQNQASSLSDYVVVSLRKWFSIPTGGWVGKCKGTLSEKPTLNSNHAVEEKIKGMREKYDYLTGKLDSKENFLLLQSKFDNDLIHVDRMLKIDDISLQLICGTDIQALIQQRRNNANILMSGLKDLVGKVIMIPNVDLAVDTPLFLPVFMETKKRDALRKYLIEKGIYCPIHWPEVMGAAPGLRTMELSLVCDQRYSEGDMQVIVDAIHSWYKTRTEA